MPSETTALSQTLSAPAEWSPRAEQHTWHTQQERVADLEEQIVSLMAEVEECNQGKGKLERNLSECRMNFARSINFMKKEISILKDKFARSINYHIENLEKIKSGNFTEKKVDEWITALQEAALQEDSKLGGGSIKRRKNTKRKKTKRKKTRRKKTRRKKY